MTYLLATLCFAAGVAVGYLFDSAAKILTQFQPGEDKGERSPEPPGNMLDDIAYQERQMERNPR